MKLNVAVKELPESEAEITVEADWKAFEPFRAKGFKSVQKNIELPGFRKGGVPESMIVSKIGEQAILEEAAEIFIQEAYADIMKQAKISPIGRPTVSITKLANGNPLSFIMRTAVLPKAGLGDYSKIAKKVNAESKKESADAETVTDKEVEDTLATVTKNQEEHMKQHHDHEGHDHALPTKEEIKTHLLQEKKSRSLEKKRLNVINGIIECSKIAVPKVLIETELEKMMQQFEADIARMGIQPKEYLAHIKKGQDELKKEWAPDAEKRVKTDIILSEIAIKEKIVADKDKVALEIKNIEAMYPGADALRAQVYVEHMLTNQAVFEFLDAQ